MISQNEVSCLGVAFGFQTWFGGFSSLYVYWSLAKHVTVSINTTYKKECCDWILIQPSTEVDDAIC